MPNLLDIDPSLLNNRVLFKDLDIVSGGDEISTDSLLGTKPKGSDDVPWKAVRPSPGYCVKLKSLEGDKVFINVCHTDEIPEPPEVSEEKLIEVLTQDDAPSFLIPMSIGDLHIESDKARNPCSVYDIAVNCNFFKKMMTSEVFNTYFLNVSVQALNEKYSLNLDVHSEKPFVLLKNRKVFGTLQVHRIEKREPRKPPTPLIQEIVWKPDSKTELSTERNKSSNKSMENRSQFESVNNRISSSLPVEQEKLPFSNSSGSAHTSTLNLPDRISVEESEKGMKECQTSKEVKTEPSIGSSAISSGASEHHQVMSELRENSVALTSENSEQGSMKVEEPSCPSVLCIRQYPEVGDPRVLVMSVHLNVDSSRDFNLELDSNRVCISIVGSGKPYFDISLPYTIDENRVEARFIVQHKKLVVKMDIEKI